MAQSGRSSPHPRYDLPERGELPAVAVTCRPRGAEIVQYAGDNHACSAPGPQQHLASARSNRRRVLCSGRSGVRASSTEEQREEE